MGRLEEAGIHSLIWQEQTEGSGNGLVFATGLQYYEIDKNNRLYVFQGPDCVSEHPCQNLQHAIGIAESSERVCRWNIAHKSTWPGYPVNEKGWKILPDGPYKTMFEDASQKIEIELFKVYCDYVATAENSNEEIVAVARMGGLAFSLAQLRGTDEQAELNAIQEKWNEAYG